MSADDDFQPPSFGVPEPPRRAQDKVLQDQALYGPAVAAQLATLSATVAALHGELYRSLNGLEKATERGFDGVGRRLDKLEDRMGTAEQRDAAVEARVQALEADAAAIGQRDNQARARLQGQRDALAESNQRFTVWQVLVGAVVGLAALAGTVAGLVSLVSG